MATQPASIAANSADVPSEERFPANTPEPAIDDMVGKRESAGGQATKSRDPVTHEWIITTRWPPITNKS